MSATMVVAKSRKDVDPKVWTPAHAALIKAAAEDPRVQRIFVNAAIKKALCRYKGHDRRWLHTVRPYWGHDYHFHVRLYCPPGSPSCKPQAEQPVGDGCGKALNWWFRDAIIHPRPRPKPKHPPKTKPKPRRGITMKDLPAACRKVLLAP
jgi:penicillin-insensitive murein DD-endopeptidase